ncbi:MAG: SHOCT domain-containing protein [Nocardioidaceae bacterium]
MLVRRVGRPGLLGTVARTAVIAGTAQMTANALHRHPQPPRAEPVEMFLYEQRVPPPRAGRTGPAGANGVNGVNGANGANGANGMNGGPVARTAEPTQDVVTQLTRLADLHHTGALSDDEFLAAKRQLLG